jgi:mRNA-degrading endonuclease RelE of RelBE toxin-antitoxin system
MACCIKSPGVCTVPFEIRLSPRAQRDLDALSPAARASIERGIARLAAGDPSVDVRKLAGSDTDRRLRVGRWRVLYIQTGQQIVIARVVRRPNAYR